MGFEVNLSFSFFVLKMKTKECVARVRRAVYKYICVEEKLEISKYMG